MPKPRWQSAASISLSYIVRKAHHESRGPGSWEAQQRQLLVIQMHGTITCTRLRSRLSDAGRREPRCYRPAWTVRVPKNFPSYPTLELLQGWQHTGRITFLTRQDFEQLLEGLLELRWRGGQGAMGAE